MPFEQLDADVKHVILEYPPRIALADVPDTSRQLLQATVEKTGYRLRQVLQDYWMVRCLYGIHQGLPKDGLLRPTPSAKDLKVGRGTADLPPIGAWAFGGGTSLTAGWRVVERYSEDVDGCLFLVRTDVSKNAQLTSRRFVAQLASEEIGAERTSIGHGQLRVSRLKLATAGVEFKLDTVVFPPCPLPDLITWLPVMSIIGRCNPDAIRRFPELGGFRLPVVSVSLTAANKLEALHRRFERNDQRGLSNRVRDVFDLASIAISEHAEAARRQIPEVAEWLATTDAKFVPRPPGGYGSSELYQPGSQAYEALRDRYLNLIANVVPSRLAASAPLDFDAAMATAASLDIS